MNLNYLFPLVGAIIPSLLQAKKSIISDSLNKDYFGRFTLNLIYAIIVLMISCTTIHANILDKVICWGEFETNHSLPNPIEITLIHYIIMIGLGVPLVLMLIFNSFIEACKIKVLTIRKAIVYTTISITLFGISLNILFVDFFLTFK